MPKKIPKSKISNPPKSFDYPCHLKSGVHPSPPPPCPLLGTQAKKEKKLLNLLVTVNVNNNDGSLKRDFYTVNVRKIQISRGTLVQSDLPLLGNPPVCLLLRFFHKHAKNQLTFAFSAAVNYLNGSLRKQNFA